MLYDFPYGRILTLFMRYLGTLNILFVLALYGPVNNEVMSSRSVNSGAVPGQA